MKSIPLVFLLFLVACAHDLTLMRRDETVHAYAAAIRWGSFDAATRFQSQHARQLAVPAAALGDIRISGYHVIGQTTDKKRMTLSQTVEIHYYRVGNLVEKTVMDEQIWRYDDDAGEWRIDTPLPIFR